MQASGQRLVFSFEITNATAAYAQAKKDGFDIVFEPEEEPWKQTHFMVRDPAGLMIDIVEDANDPKQVTQTNSVRKLIPGTNYRV